MKNKEIYILVAIAFLFIIGGFFIFSHYQEKLRMKERDIKKINEKIKVINQFQKVDKEWQEYAKEFLFSDFFSLKKEIEGIAKNIRIKNWSILSSRKEGLISQQRGKIVFYTTYENFIDFLKNLEKYSSIKIESLSVKNKKGNLNIELEFTGKTLR